MPISRRRLTAAGLALTTVGAIGVTSTLNASAAELTIPQPVAALPSVAGAVDDETPPPPPLPPDGDFVQPGGTRATRSLSGLSAQRRIAAPSDPLPKATAVYAPKGLPPVPGADGASPASAALNPRARMALPAQAATPAQAALQATQPSVNYFHATASKFAIVDGTSAWLTIGKPAVDAGDTHSVGQIAVRSVDDGGTSKQVLEVGWIVSRQVNKDDKANLDEPHLFIHYWLDDKNVCYNCDYQVPSGAANKPGDLLPVGATKKFGILHDRGGWWIFYDTSWVAYLPDSVWKGQFTKVELVQWYGEVAAGDSVPCSDMGNGNSSIIDSPEPGRINHAAAGIRQVAYWASDLSLTPLNFSEDDLKPSETVGNARYKIHRFKESNSTRFNSLRYGGKGGPGAKTKDSSCSAG